MNCFVIMLLETRKLCPRHFSNVFQLIGHVRPHFSISMCLSPSLQTNIKTMRFFDLKICDPPPKTVSSSVEWNDNSIYDISLLWKFSSIVSGSRHAVIISRRITNTVSILVTIFAMLYSPGRLWLRASTILWCGSLQPIKFSIKYLLRT